MYPIARKIYVYGMEKGGKCKDMEEIRCLDGMRRLACISFSPSFSCCGFIKDK